MGSQVDIAMLWRVTIQKLHTNFTLHRGFNVVYKAVGDVTEKPAGEFIDNVNVLTLLQPREHEGQSSR